MLPNRIPTGVRNTTIPNPVVVALREYSNVTSFEGSVAKYRFERQAVNFSNLQGVLRYHNKDFDQVAAVHYKGDLGINHRFVVTTRDGSLLWYKYVGFAAQSGQNHVFVAGMRIKVSRFLGYSPAMQGALLRGDADLAKSNAEWRPGYNENGSLWN
jgi:hypothetical protein